MLSDNNKQYSSDGTIEVPTGSTSLPQVTKPPLPTPYDYLGLLPGLITAITPLILAMINLRKISSKPDVKDKDNIEKGRRQRAEGRRNKSDGDSDPS